MGVFSYLFGTENNGDDLENESSEDAIEIILTPNKLDRIIDISVEDLLDTLNGENVSAGFVIGESELSDDFLDEDMELNDISKLMEDILCKTKIIVKETTPKGTVRITKRTKIILEQKEPSIEDIPKDKIIEVVECPSFKDYIEIKNFRDLVKLGAGDNLINKFQKDNEVIYVCKPYYFKA